ncbi:immunoglobulin-like domain-containing protein [Sphingobacterium sp. SG20118]|uniref:immunoglobulin-like domain-containing protein n=1 Tax=Sphingobacterium sp. SG20118 TaxID=3367156 RepID=UPI0037DFC69A
MMRNLILLVISATLLFSCNQTNKRERQTTKKEQVNDKEDKSISLSVDPKVFILSQIPDTIKVIITNNTNDTITTGLRYQIENYEDNEWKEISPKDILFHDLGWRLKPSESENFNMKLYKDQINYKTGKYRIVKYYLNSDYQKTRESHNVYGQFDIK